MKLLQHYVLLLFLSPLVTIGIHILISRANRTLQTRWPPQVVTIVAILVGYPAVGLVAWEIYFRHLPAEAARFGDALYGFLVYGNLSYAYFHLYNMSETARRIRILYELRVNGQMSREAIDARYPPESQLHVRLERLLGMGQLEQAGGRYKVKSRLLWLSAMIILGWGEFIGFDHLKRRS